MKIIKENKYNEKNEFTEYYLNKIIIYIFMFLIASFIFLNINYFPKKVINKNQIRPYIKYIIDCKNHKRYNRIKIIKENPYISVCIPALNMNKYIERAILSIINQSFQDFEIIIINDNSKDDTEEIVTKLKLEDNRIKLINHNNNKGVYYSRVEAILFSKGNYIILMDPDDLYLNENLFKELYTLFLKKSHLLLQLKILL